MYCGVEFKLEKHGIVSKYVRLDLASIINLKTVNNYIMLRSLVTLVLHVKL